MHYCQKMQLLLERIAKNHDFGDFWWFSWFWHDVTYDVTVASHKVCLYFFWYRWTREGYSYPLVPHTWCFVNRFPRSWGAESPRLWDGSKKPGSFRVKGHICSRGVKWNTFWPWPIWNENIYPDFSDWLRRSHIIKYSCSYCKLGVAVRVCCSYSNWSYCTMQ